MSQHSNGSADTATAKATAPASELPPPHKRFPSGHEIAHAVRDALGELGLDANCDEVRDLAERKINWKPSAACVGKQRRLLKLKASEEAVVAVRVEPEDDDEPDSGYERIG